jgi:hypothetical protein
MIYRLGGRGPLPTDGAGLASDSDFLAYQRLGLAAPFESRHHTPHLAAHFPVAVTQACTPSQSADLPPPPALPASPGPSAPAPAPPEEARVSGDVAPHLSSVLGPGPVSLEDAIPPHIPHRRPESARGSRPSSAASLSGGIHAVTHEHADGEQTAEVLESACLTERPRTGRRMVHDRWLHRESTTPGRMEVRWSTRRLLSPPCGHEDVLRYEYSGGICDSNPSVAFAERASARSTYEQEFSRLLRTEASSPDGGRRGREALRARMMAGSPT